MNFFKKWILEGHVWDREEMVCAVGLPHVLASIPFLKEWQVKLKINQYKITNMFENDLFSDNYIKYLKFYALS